ncbi:MAG TPA: GtrA family protein [Verrucomicrobiae bacterium]|nr:GtrA family protein [Verrucomicrobiae bacterium]
MGQMPINKSQTIAENPPSDARGAVKPAGFPTRMSGLIATLAGRFGLSSSLADLLRRYLRFGVVGGSGVAVDMAALFFLADPRTLHLDISLSKALAAEIAIFSNFVGNEFWTFADMSGTDLSWRGRAGRLGKFNLICLAGIGLSVLLLNVQTHYLQMNMLTFWR